tara:strand:+ start:4998 stop:5267 length:270 start_codon:yes stop_codon:yes gene_type:complete
VEVGVGRTTNSAKLRVEVEAGSLDKLLAMVVTEAATATATEATVEVAPAEATVEVESPTVLVPLKTAVTRTGRSRVTRRQAGSTESRRH